MARERPGWMASFPFPSKYQAVEEGLLHYVDVGSGSPVLLVHGSPMWSFTFRTLIERLRSNHRVVAVDLPGLGASKARLTRGAAFETNARLIGGFIQALDLRDCTVLAHATATPSVMRVVADEPQRFRKVIVNGGFGWPLEGALRLRLMLRLVGSAPFRWLTHRLNLLPWLTSHFGRRNGRFDSAERRAILGPYRDISARWHLTNILSSLRSERAFFERLQSDLQGGLQPELFLLFGELDPSYEMGFLDRWRALFPKAPSAVLFGAGHFAIEDAPVDYGDQITEWLETK